MATKGLGIEQECFCCSICLDLLKVPVTIPCGHSYCMNCVNTHWDGEVGKQSYSCPQCRQNFTQRPVLVKNTMLALLMEGFNKSGAPAAPESDCSAANGDVSCDLCSGRKVKAVKSCLQCLVSYCKEHLQPHYDVAALKKHKLTEPTANLQDNICSRHDEVMKMFCRTDQQCICFLCSVDEHKDHDTVTAAAARTEKDRELETFKDTILLILDQKKKNMSKLQGEVKEMLSSADSAMDCSDRGLKDLIGLVEQSVNDLKKQIRDEQEADTRRAVELQDKLRREITELERKRTELDSLSRTQDHLQFLHKFASISKVCDASAGFYKGKTPSPYCNMVKIVLSQLSDKIQPPSVVEKTKANPSQSENQPTGEKTKSNPSKSENQSTGGKTKYNPYKRNYPDGERRKYYGRIVLFHHDVSPPNEPLQLNNPDEFPALPSKTLASLQANARDYGALVSDQDFAKYARKLKWDPRSLYERFELSEQNLQVQLMPGKQNHAAHPARFTDLPQAVSKQSLDGRCSWEVSGDRNRALTVAVAYKDVRRDGSSDACAFGMNGKSWALQCFAGQRRCQFWHRGKAVELELSASVGVSIGVFTDVTAGVLAFYRPEFQSVIYATKTTFTKPLVAGIRFDSNDVGCKVKISRRLFN